MAIGRRFEEAVQKALRMMDPSAMGFDPYFSEVSEVVSLVFTTWHFWHQIFFLSKLGQFVTQLQKITYKIAVILKLRIFVDKPLSLRNIKVLENDE